MREYTQPAARSLPGDAGASRRRCARVRNTALSRACPKAKWGPFPQALKGWTVPGEVRHYHGDHCLRPSALSDGPDPGRRRVAAQRDRDWSPRTGCDRNESAESMTIGSSFRGGGNIAATLFAFDSSTSQVSAWSTPITQLVSAHAYHFHSRAGSRDILRLVAPDLRPAKAVRRSGLQSVALQTMDVGPAVLWQAPGSGVWRPSTPPPARQSTAPMEPIAKAVSELPRVTPPLPLRPGHLDATIGNLPDSGESRPCRESALVGMPGYRAANSGWSHEHDNPPWHPSVDGIDA